MSLEAGTWSQTIQSEASFVIVFVIVVVVAVVVVEVTYLYISGITTKPKQSECDVNSYNKDTIAICTCECPDLMKQLIFQGYGVFICTKC